MTRDDETRLLALAAHELRGPSAVLAGYLKLLAREAEALPERAKTLIGNALGASAKLHALVDELTDVVRVASGERTPALRPLPLEVLAADVVAHAAARPGAPAVTIGALPNVMLPVDREPIAGALAALAWAAARPSGDATAVTLTGVVESGARPRVTLTLVGGEAEVSSTPGVVDDTRGGMGFALPLARLVIEAHGGTLHECATTGAGPAFVVTLATGAPADE